MLRMEGRMTTIDGGCGGATFTKRMTEGRRVLGGEKTKMDTTGNNNTGVQASSPLVL